MLRKGIERNIHRAELSRLQHALSVGMPHIPLGHALCANGNMNDIEIGKYSPRINPRLPFFCQQIGHRIGIILLLGKIHACRGITFKAQSIYIEALIFLS